MNNIDVVDQIREYSAPYLQALAEREERPFLLGDLEINNGIFLGDAPIEGRGMRNILNRLQIRKGFMDFSKVMTPEDWEFISRKLKDMDPEARYYAVVERKGDAETIIDTLPFNQSSATTDELRHQQYIDWICDSLTSTDKEYQFKGMDYDPARSKFSLTLLENREVDVFNSGQDLWKIGDLFQFNGLQFGYNPFFERLSCTNGAVSRQYGFGANISQSKFNGGRIEKVIRRSIEELNAGLDETLRHSVDHLTRHNVSINEFEHFKKFFDIRNEGGKFDKLIYELFDDRPFYNAYGENISEKSRKWKSTANTGINAYDFFNMMTWIASHPDKVEMENEDRLKLQMSATDFLFKANLDLEDVAGVREIAYPRLDAML